MEETVIVAGARTPIGKLLGGLASVAAPELGAHAIREALARAGVSAADVEEVLMGNVVQAGVGPNPARQAALSAGIGLSTPAATLNKLCPSGLATITALDRSIRLGERRVAVAGGFESMTQAPHLVRGARAGFSYGDGAFEDALNRDALFCAIDHCIMGEGTEKHQEPYGLSREELDSFSAESHHRAAAAREAGYLAEEIVPIEVPGRRGAVTVADDEGIREGTTAESLARLRPAFAKNGIITAGSSSQLSDGGCALVLMSRAEADRRGLPWLARVLGGSAVAGPDTSLLLQPARAIEAACAAAGVSVADLDLLEMNEAFAGVTLLSARELNVDLDRVNVNGGAIALGHPVGMSGARIVLTLAMELRRRGGGIGAAGLCGGGGQGDALVIEVPAG
ncbi:acetyl-CoA C-acyltransferase [Leucobacter viscericola]|uniref:Probable acetyl-CoA acetyltransferase n=1 Tax=Leucobacter viscericola TaxID=2714935 RepID=A0A6G7XIU9_9MICO|nr:acetyl-CoA C-acyltransferase [Leucobacter viscericola]QIK64359.1 acetyl-CoA C-acyltransferase [Leucobacter viscericola]